MAARSLSNDPDTRARILAAAGEVFAQIGFSGARVDDIAERAGINKAMLYYHVGDKEHLYEVVLTETIERGLASFRQATENLDSPSEKLQAIIDAITSFGISHPNFVPIMVREIASGGVNLPDEMLLRMASVFRVVADVLAEGVSRGVFRATDPLLSHVSLVGSMMFLVATQPIRDRLRRIAGMAAESHSPAELARHAGNLFLHGLEIHPVKSKKMRSRKTSTTRKERS